MMMMITWDPVRVPLCHLVIEGTEGETEVSAHPEMSEKSHASETGGNKTGKNKYHMISLICEI